jgi:hypothetical protein
MNNIPVTDTAFTGFRVMKEHIRSFGWWVLLSFLWSLVANVALLAVGFKVPDAASVQGDPTQAFSLLAHLAPVMLGVGFASLVINAVIYATMNRVILRPGENRWGYVRLGGAELNQFGVLLVLVLLFLAVYFGLVIAVALLTALATLAGKMAAIIVGAMSVATALCALAVLGVRLSLSPAVTFDEGRIDLGRSWALTRGRFWPMLGTYVLATALALVVMLLAWLVEMGLGAVVTGGHMQSFVSGQPETLAALYDPIYLFRLVLGSVINALVWPLVLTPAPAIYRHLAPAPGTPPA